MTEKAYEQRSLESKNEDFTKFLDTIDTLPPPSPILTRTTPPSIPRSTSNSPLPPLAATQGSDTGLPLLSSADRTTLPQITSTDPPTSLPSTPSSQEKSKSNWSSLGSWFQNVVIQETQIAKSMVSQNIKSLGEMTQQLLQESQTATQKLKESTVWQNVLDTFSDTMSLSFSFNLAGLSHVQQLDQACAELMTSMFAKRGLQVHLTSCTSDFRSFIFEEVSCDFNEVYEKSVFATPPDGTSYTVGFHVAPIFWHHQYLIYLCTVHGCGHVKRTLSQSILKETKDVDEEWERLVLRSAFRASLDEWMHAIDFSHFLESNKVNSAIPTSTNEAETHPQEKEKKLQNV